MGEWHSFSVDKKRTVLNLEGGPVVGGFGIWDLLQKIGRLGESDEFRRIGRIKENRTNFGLRESRHSSDSPNSSYSWKRPIFCNRPLDMPSERSVKAVF